MSQDNGIASKDKKVKEMDTFLGKLERQHITLSEQKENDKQKFLEIRNGIAPENHDAVMAEREAIRPDGKVGLVQKLYATYKDKYRSEIFDEANRQIDAELQEKPILKKKRSISEQLKSPRQEVPYPLFVFIFDDKLVEFGMISKVCTLRISFQPIKKN